MSCTVSPLQLKDLICDKHANACHMPHAKEMHGSVEQEAAEDEDEDEGKGKGKGKATHNGQRERERRKVEQTNPGL